MPVFEPPNRTRFRLPECYGPGYAICVLPGRLRMALAGSDCLATEARIGQARVVQGGGATRRPDVKRQNGAPRRETRRATAAGVAGEQFGSCAQIGDVLLREVFNRCAGTQEDLGPSNRAAYLGLLRVDRIGRLPLEW